MLETKEIRLRDFVQTDIEKRITWETIETEWQQWDAPWEIEGLTAEEREEELKDYIAMLEGWAEYYRDLSPEMSRGMFQIETKEEEPRYIGWVTSYWLDEDFNYSDGQTQERAIGIDLPDMAARGKGYAYQALALFIRYLLEKGEKEIYTQTWSGNTRMIHIAEKMGFEECRRKRSIRIVRGEYYDGLSFQLNQERFQMFWKQYIANCV